MTKEQLYNLKIAPLQESAQRKAQARLDAIAKPLDGLGQFEKLIVQIAGITGSDKIQIDKRAILAMCADNGVVAEGVTQTSSEVTAIVAVNMATAGQVCMVHKASSIGRGDPRYYEIRPHFDGLYCHTISRMPSGRNMEVLVDLIAEIGEKIYGQKATSAEIWKKLGETGSAQSTQGLSVDVSFYETPEQLADGGISHIDRANLTLENLFGAAYADLGRKYAHYIRMMEEAVGQKATRMVFCGGAVRNNPMIRRALENEVGLEGLLFGSGDEVHEGMMRLAKSIEKAKENKGE